ncbi:hypothetical protein [Candidatus Electronema sp. PJ]|uniref:hypothetical protein n=1 Tax=Candidatus Electronema sp. PJ TaxID=3401572 RepID=UPI003AA8EC07
MKKWLAGVLILLASPVYAGENILYYRSETGDYIGQGKEKTYTDADLTFSASKNYDNGVTVSMENFTDTPFLWWDANFAAPGDVLLQVGVYENATRFPFQASNVPGLDFSGDGRGCNELTGRFEVKEIVYGAGDTITSFAADFEQHCEGGEAALYGSVRYNSDVPVETGDQCQATVAALQAQVESLQGQVDALQAQRDALQAKIDGFDIDGDGEYNGTDRCPDTNAGASVDDSGCSLTQYCKQQTTKRRCIKADWQHDELGVALPHDCKVVKTGRTTFNCESILSGKIDLVP